MILNRILIALAVVFLFSPVANADLSKGILDDGEFNLATSGTVTSNSGWQTGIDVVNRPDGVNWAMQFETSAEARSDGAPGDGGGFWFRPFEGRQSAGNPLAEGTLSQSVAAGSNNDFVLSVDWAREADFQATVWTVTFSKSGLGGTDSLTFDLLAATGAVGNFDEILSSQGGPNVFDLRLNGIVATDTLEVFVEMRGGEDNGGSANQSGYLDNFNLRAVPEPTSTGILMLSTLGLIGFRRRR
ncbi:MAG: hypothetical protein ACI87E_004506 [Mariniblastus sp.]